jgi:LAS superfamily LD-carboxypeptidase LdcB
MKNVIFSLCLLLSINFYGQNEYSKNALTGKGDLELVGNTHKLQPEAMEAFQKMKKAAMKDGVDIMIASAYRSFEDQKRIWNRKYVRFANQGKTPDESINEIIKYSTFPGTSRHHWGTEIDVIQSVENQPKDKLIESNYEKKGAYAALKKWMNKNAHEFGFHLVYTNDRDRSGFNYEPWHYSYRPLSKEMLRQFLCLRVPSLFDIAELEGIEHISRTLKHKYLFEQVLGVNSQLLTIGCGDFYTKVVN